MEIRINVEYPDDSVSARPMRAQKYQTQPNVLSDILSDCVS